MRPRSLPTGGLKVHIAWMSNLAKSLDECGQLSLPRRRHFPTNQAAAGLIPVFQKENQIYEPFHTSQLWRKL